MILCNAVCFRPAHFGFSEIWTEFRNPRLQSGSPLIEFKNPWKIIADQTQNPPDLSRIANESQPIQELCGGLVVGTNEFCTRWLALLNDFRTFDWAEEYKYPTVVLDQMKGLLAKYENL